MFALLTHIVLEASSDIQGSGGGDTASTNTIVAVLGAGGVGAILAAIVTGLFSKRKLGAEATQIITNAAAGVVKSMEADLTRTKRDMEAMAAAHVHERREWQKVLQLHVAWDAMAIARLAEMQITMPPVPPVTPAQRFVDDNGYPVGGVD